MHARQLLSSALGAMAMFPAVFSSAHADDIDLYVENSMATGSVPYVMFSLDYRSNLNSSVGWDDNWPEAFKDQFTEEQQNQGLTFFDLLRGALKVVMEPLDGVHVGFMMSHDDTCKKNAGPDATGCSNGGYILSGFTTDKEKFHKVLGAVPVPQGNRSHPYQGKELFFEFFRYLTGQGKYNSELGWDDFGGNGNENLDTRSFNGESGVLKWDTDIEFPNNKRYKTPIKNDCSKFYTINFAFGVSNQDSESDDAITASRASGGMGPDQYGQGGINLKGKNDDVTTVIKYLHDVDLGNGTFGEVPELSGKQNVTSYFVGQGHNKLNDYASAGGTGRALEASEDPAELIAALKNVFSQILSVSTTFVSASIPVNVFNRAEYLDSVYVALFQADGNPRWPGNLKKLRLAEDEFGDRSLLDADGRPAMDVESGRIAYNALTFWTDPNADDVQAFDDTEGEIRGKDGRSVARGGAGQQVAGFLAGSDDPGIDNGSGSRKLFTEPESYGSGPTSLRGLAATTTMAADLWTYLNADSVVASKSGSTGTDGYAARNAYAWSAAENYASASADEKDTALRVLCHMRGLGWDAAARDCGDPRAEWLMGDPLHSRPLPLNYGARGSYTAENPDIRILMGSNDGFMRMFINTTSSGEQSGEEAWGFAPLETLAIQKRLTENGIDDPDTAEEEYIHPYGVDGPASTYVRDANGDGTINASDGDTAWVFFGLRRGGKGYYALDITDPDNPKFLWKITPDTTGFEELGLSFSTPRVAQMDLRATDEDEPDLAPVIVFGGGYDVDKDVRQLGTDDDEGTAIYIVEAETGELIKKLTHPDLVDSIASEVTPVDTDGDRQIDRIYVGDTGGNVWRADVGGGSRNSATWELTKLAELGRHYNASETHDRRFFHPPDFVQAQDSRGTAFDAVTIGSGDRSDPLGNKTENWLYMIKDHATQPGTRPAGTVSHSDLADLTNNCYQEVGVACTESQTQANADYGWRVKLEDEGEKSLAVPLTIDGQVFYTSFVPPDASAEGTCGPAEGQGWVYHLDLHTAAAVMDYDTSNSVQVGDEIIDLQRSDRKKRAGYGIPGEVISAGDDHVLDGSGDPTKVPVSSAWRTYWYQSED